MVRYSESRDIDYVLIDVGPSSGALTRACFLSCDGYFVPTAPDRFNVQAIGTLSTIISKWIKEHRQVFEDFQELGLPIREGMPKFLGVILQNFKIRGGKPKPTYQMWMDRIPAKVESSLLPAITSFNNDGRDLSSGLNGNSIVVTQIRDFEGLAPIMQECGKAMFDITISDTRATNPKGTAWSGVAWSQAEERMAHYKGCIAQMAKNLENLL